MNPPSRSFVTWWRGPTDPDTLASEAETQRELARRQTIRISQNTTAKQTGSSLLSAPTPGPARFPTARTTTTLVRASVQALDGKRYSLPQVQDRGAPWSRRSHSSSGAPRPKF